MLLLDTCSRRVNRISGPGPGGLFRQIPRQEEYQKTVKPFGELVRFGIVGSLATLTHVLLFFILARTLLLHPTVATTLAFAGAVGVSYSLNRRWTFRVTGNHARHFPRFMAIALACAGLNAAIMQVGVEVMGWSPTHCLVIIVLTLPLLSFSLQRQWGFR